MKKQTVFTLKKYVEGRESFLKSPHPLPSTSHITSIFQYRENKLSLVFFQVLIDSLIGVCAALPHTMLTFLNWRIDRKFKFFPIYPHTFIYSQLTISRTLISQNTSYIKECSFDAFPTLFTFQLLLSQTSDISK